MKHETAEILVAAVTDHCNDYDFSTVYSDILGVFPHSSGANGNTGTGKCRLLHRSDQFLRENSMELAREVAFSALGDPMLQKNMQRTEFYLSSMGRGALEQMVGSVTAYQSAWSRNVLSSIYLFRDDGQYTFIPPRGLCAGTTPHGEHL